MITQGLSRNRIILATAGTMLALLLAALDQTIVGTAIPRIVADLNGLDRLAWVTTAYLVTSTTMTPIAGKLGDLFGRKPFLLAGMVGFVAASALCGLSQDMTQLIVFRGVQGVFGGVLFATVFTVIGEEDVRMDLGELIGGLRSPGADPGRVGQLESDGGALTPRRFHSGAELGLSRGLEQQARS